MPLFNRLIAAVLAVLLLGPVVPLQARTRKGDKFLGQGRSQEQKKAWDDALEAYEQALSEDPEDIVYQMSVDKARFQAAQMHIENGMRVRGQGQLGEALIEFQKAFGLNPGSAVAQQEIQRTQQMIQRERRKVEETGKESTVEERSLTPVEQMKKQEQEKIERMLPVPELRPLNPKPIDLKMNGQKSRVVYETLGKVAGINVLWDPEFQAPQRDAITIDFNNSTLEEALDYVAILTKTYWKALSTNTIFITNDNPNKRREYEEQVSKVFYLNNVSSQQDVTEIVNAVRGVADLQRVFAVNAQNAILVRAEADRVALAEKIIRDLDKPRAEVVVDVIVMEANSVFKRELTAALAAGGLNVPFNFTPRSKLGPAPTTSGDNASADTATSSVFIKNLRKLSSEDYSTTLPSALLQAALTDTKSKILQSPQVRSLDNIKATLKIGNRQPTATGSYQSGVAGVAVSGLMNTQFTYIDVGVNVDLTPRVHDNGDVSMHVEVEISAVNGKVDLGGIEQPIIGQRKVVHDIRMREGEVGLLGGLINQSETKTVTGIPGLNSIPILRRLFSGESIERDRGELMIALVPHVIRRPEVNTANLRGVAVGNATSIRLTYAPKNAEEMAVTPGAPGPAAPQAPAMPAPVPQVPLAAEPAAPPASAPPATAPPVTAPPAAPGPPALLPPATAPPEAAPPATAPPAAAPQAQASGTILFSQSQVETTQSGSFTVTLVIQNGADVVSAPIQLRYDPKILRLNDAAPGEYFGRDGQQPLVTRNIQNDTGTATIQISRPPGTAGVSGPGALVTLSFQAVGKGSTMVIAPNVAARNSAGAAVVTASPQMVVSVK